MATHQTPAQKETVERVMHEFKHGELKTARGARKVKNRKQAVAIALHEAGASRNESSKKNVRNLRRTKAKERRGETYRDEAEGRGGRKAAKSTTHKAATHRTAARTTKTSRARSGNGDGQTKAQLYEQAKRRDIPGRSKMSKAQLERALHA